ncbi:MAG TPA: FAD-dependent oxidoreductase [Rhizomicrobium sp.]
MRYDVAIIGAGADGLAAAALLARAKLATLVIERNERCGGRVTTREFHPGFRASPFVDELPPIPASLHWALDLSRRGAIFLPAPLSTALWPDRRSTIRRSDFGFSPTGRLLKQAAFSVEAVCRRAEIDSEIPARSWPRMLGRKRAPQPWPGAAWTSTSLSQSIGTAVPGADEAAHVCAGALWGRAADPFLAGTALHLLASGRSRTIMGGLERMADALTGAANEAGAEIRCGLEASEIRTAEGRATIVVLADGTEIEARAMISTLDLRRSFLSLFKWSELPPLLLNRIRNFRMAGATARLLLALDRLPDSLAGLGEALRGPVHLAPDFETAAQAYAAWCVGLIPEAPPLTLRVVSVSDPSLAPVGGAVIAVTAGCIPYRLFDGAWTHARREELRMKILAQIDEALPGVSSHILGAELIVPPDIEEQIGASEGDLAGGELAADQMLDLRPGLEALGARTPIRGFYLAGPSTAAGALATCAAGAIAAATVLADLKAGRLR